MVTIGSLLSGRRLLVVGRATSVLEAAREMTRDHVGAVLVLDDLGRPAGIFTERDLMVRVVVAERDPWRTRVEEVMTVGVLIARYDEPVALVEREMQRHHVRHIPVVDRDGRAIAMLSLRDLLRRDLVEREQELQALHDYIAASDAVETHFNDPPTV